MLIPFHTPRIPANLAFVVATTQTANQSIYTFTNHSIGAEHPGRLVVVCVSTSGSLGNSVTGVTCGGTSMTKVCGAEQSVAENASIYSLGVTTGTTATIIVSNAGTRNNLTIHVYTITGLESQTAIDSATAGSSGTTTVAAAIDYKDGGAVIGVAEITANTTSSWDVITEQSDTVVESITTNTSASGVMNSDATGQTITVTFGSTSGKALALASWR